MFLIKFLFPPTSATHCDFFSCTMFFVDKNLKGNCEMFSAEWIEGGEAVAEPS